MSRRAQDQRSEVERLRAEVERLRADREDLRQWILQCTLEAHGRAVEACQALLSVKELAAWLGCSTRTWYRIVAEQPEIGELSIPVRGHDRWPAWRVALWLRQRGIDATS